MRAAAPGKLVVTGAYAVLEGAPAIVLAVDRCAIADTARTADPVTREVREALGDGAAPFCDATALADGGTKLGLGSSAAVLVATLGALALDRGEDLESGAVRRAIFDVARDAHARAQGGGSGVDVAASVWGGALVYVRGLRPRAVRLPPGLVWEAFFSGASARTSELRARVDAAQPGPRARAMNGLAEAARAAERALALGAPPFVAAARDTGAALAELGAVSGAPIVTAAVRELSALAAAESAAFLPSGAGGGDVALWVGSARPSPAFLCLAEALGMRPLDLGLDQRGLRAVSSARRCAPARQTKSLRHPKES